MSFTARTLADTVRLAAEEARTLRVFIDDLDGWDGQDLDTGTNAWRTLDALSAVLDRCGEQVSFATALEVASDAGVVVGVGHCGQMLTILFHSWLHAVESAEALTPVVVRHMLQSSLVHPTAHMDWSPSVRMLLDECASELASLGDTVPDTEEIVTMYASHCQFAMIEATNQSTGRIDPGAAVLALVFTCCDAVLRDDVSLLTSFAHMLADLAASSQRRGPRAHPPAQNRAFTVDMIVSGSHTDVVHIQQRLDMLGARYSSVGREDFFGLGEWRFHVDTAAPLAVCPRGVTARSVTVADARPHEMLGVDGLSDAVVHRGVQILERPSMRRVERAHVVVLSNAPGMLELHAQTGATVMLHPQPSDVQFLRTVAAGSTTGVTLLIPTDRRTADLAHTLADSAPAHMRLIVAPSTDELTAYSLAKATATVFVPQPGGCAAAESLIGVLNQAIGHTQTTARTMTLDTGNVAEMSAAVDALLACGSHSWRLIMGEGADPQTPAVIQHLLPPTAVSPMDIGDEHATPITSYDVIDGQYAGPTVLQGHQ